MAAVEEQIREVRPSSAGAAEARRRLARFRVQKVLAEGSAPSGWPAYGQTVHPKTGYVAENVPLYTSRKTGKNWAPRNELEERAILTDTPRWVLLRGGEGSGKSAGAVIKALERLRRGMDGVLASPDFEHLKESVWPLFAEWCPPDVVDKTDRHMLEVTWEAQRKFELHLRSEGGRVSMLRCRGVDDPESVRGSNVHFVIFDEASRNKQPTAFRFLARRARLTGPKGEPPQVITPTTPAMHWLYDYFGPPKTDEPDPFARFKESAIDVRLRTEDNLQNLDAEFLNENRALLSEAEKKVYLEGEWEDLSEGVPFLEAMIWWDKCRENLPPLTNTEPLIAGMDAGISGDPFAFVAVGRHPWREGVLCPRLTRLWVPTKGRQLDFELIQADIELLCSQYNILSAHYDPWQCHHMGTALRMRKIVHTVEFKQGGEINVADKSLLDAVMEQKVAWSPQDEGSGLLYEHLRNADRKLDENRKIRIKKRTDSKKVDAARAFSMGRHRALRLWKTQPSYPRSSARSDYR